MARSIFVLGPEGPHKWELDKKPDLAWLQKHVGGYIEMLPLSPAHINPTLKKFGYEVTGKLDIYVNEDGAYMDLPFNPHATEIGKAGGVLMVPPGIKGNMIIIGREK